MSNRWPYYLAFLVLGIISVLGFFLLFEYTTRKVFTGYKGEARSNPYFAAHRFLEESGLNCQSLPKLSDLEAWPEQTDTIIFFGNQRYLSPSQLDRLEAWVERGGHLLIAIHPKDPLENSLAAYGIGSDWQATVDEIQETIQIDTFEDEEPVTVDFSQNWTLIHSYEDDPESIMSEGDLHVQIDENYLLVSQRFDQGRLTLLPGFSHWNNDNIAKEDHAAFLYQILNNKTMTPDQAGAGPNTVWMFYGHESKSIWDLLPREAWILFKALAAFLLYWLWRQIPRFGPVRPNPPLARRSLLEHIEAAGNFLWQHGQGGTLIEIARNHFWRDFWIQHSDWVRLEKDEIFRRMANLTGFPEAKIRLALAEPVNADKDRFTVQMQMIDQLRRTL